MLPSQAASRFENLGVVNFLPPLLPSAAIAAALPPGPHLIESEAVQDAGRIGVQPLFPAATFVSNDGASIISNDGASLIGQDAAGLLGQDAAGLLGQDAAGFKVGGQALAAARTGRSTLAAVAETGYVKTGGEIDLTGLMISGPVTLDGGVLTGPGVILGNLTNNGGFIAPGNPAGSLLVTGDFTQGPQGILVMEAAGGAAGQFDQLLVGGAASLGGNLEMRFIGGYVPLPNDSLNPIGFTSATGAFDSISSNAQLDVAPTGLIAVLDPAQVPLPGDLPISLTDARHLEGGNFLLRSKGLPVGRYTIEASISLKDDFKPIDTVTAAPDGTFEFQDVNAPVFSARFYRAVGP